MPIPFTCPHCGLQTNVADQYAGQSGPCAGCGNTITLPTAPQQVGYSAPPPRKRSTPIVLIVVLALAVVLVCAGLPIALLLPAVQSAREAARRAQCSNNLKQIGLAIHNYHACHGCLPPACIADENGRPMHSWRVLILPFIEQSPLYDQYDFDEPWDGPANAALADLMPQIYRCPSDGTAAMSETSYAMIVGPGTLFEDAEVTRFHDVLDGLSNTIMVVEVAGAGIPWMEPMDLDVEQISLRINQPVGPEIRSHHPGGVNVLICDGSVRFVSETIDPEVLKALITKAGKEAVGAF